MGATHQAGVSIGDCSAYRLIRLYDGDAERIRVVSIGVCWAVVGNDNRFFYRVKLDLSAAFAYAEYIL